MPFYAAAAARIREQEGFTVHLTHNHGRFKASLPGEMWADADALAAAGALGPWMTAFRTAARADVRRMNLWVGHCRAGISEIPSETSPEHVVRIPAFDPVRTAAYHTFRHAVDEAAATAPDGAGVTLTLGYERFPINRPAIHLLLGDAGTASVGAFPHVASLVTPARPADTITETAFADWVARLRASFTELYEIAVVLQLPPPSAHQRAEAAALAARLSQA